MPPQPTTSSKCANCGEPGRFHYAARAARSTECSPPVSDPTLEPPCRHPNVACDDCWKKHVKLSIAGAKCHSEATSRTAPTKIQCLSCEEMMRDVDIWFRGGLRLYREYKVLHAVELQRLRKPELEADFEFVDEIDVKDNEEWQMV
ncbi:hypothetical protein CERZMDRAFT_80929 [Cercospora zeae-maydis SCOH1-5]|uniref:Uncharacterized protein n=1 Tax=Cercospora zeae-maydis SCOH1-5 TaxID=717836 RepID=A0A6A6FU71_9PEZI|nr:hypothetical protein CERZMDRAFT_80929 [Cercospora zeae-maydis SCOH1-5]